MNDERGFTLSELLVSVAIIGVVMAGVFVLQQQGQIAYLWGSARVEAQQNARLALDLMTRELRSALSITTGCTSTSSPATTITFVDASSNSVTYALSGTVLRRTYSGATSDIIGGVTTFEVHCYNSDGYTLTATSSSIRSLKVVVQTKSESGATSGSPSAQRATLESRVKLRNL